MFRTLFMLQIEECVVCSDKKATVLFKPCGHMCACESQFILCFLSIILMSSHVTYTCLVQFESYSVHAKSV